MPFFKSARSRAALGIAVMVIVLAATTGVALLQARQQQAHLNALRSASLSAASLQHARGEFLAANTSLASLGFGGDPSNFLSYQNHIRITRLDLLQARFIAEEQGRGGDVAALERLIDKVTAFDAEIDEAAITFLAGGANAGANIDEAILTAAAQSIIQNLQAAAESEQAAMVAETEASSQIAGQSLWIVATAGGISLLLAGGIVVTLAVSVVRPLTSLRESARRVADGNLDVRARAYGPEEVSSLARDFNVMTDALVNQHRDLSALNQSLEERVKERTGELLEANRELQAEVRVRTEAEERFSKAFQASPAAICIVRMEARTFLDVNESFVSISGYSRDELLDQTADGLGLWADERERDKAGALLDENSQVRSMEARLRTKNGDIRDVILWAELVTLAGEPCILTLLHDVTERLQAEQALRESEERYRDLVELSPEPIAVHVKGRLVYINRAGADMIGAASPEEVVGRPVLDFVHPDYREQVIQRMQQVQVGERIGLMEEKLVRLDGQVIDVEVVGIPIVYDGQPGSQLIIRDVTERKKAEQTIRHLAYHDGLTELPNRAMLTERLEEALEEAREAEQMLTVMFLDLDGFKRVNDSVGHVEGDQLLRRVGALLKSHVGEGGFVARAGGDEFTLLFPNTSGVAAVEMAEGILGTLRAPQMVGGQEFIVTTSIGVTVFPHDGEDVDTLLRNADVAMYRAKEQGRDNYQLYTSSMTTRIFERLVMESDMRRGLKRKEFVVYYQPQLDAKTGEIVSVEALVRWQHPERGLILPGEFIPLAEETGLILDLGEHVVRASCTQAQKWAKKGLPIKRVAINLSAHRFRQPQSMEPIQDILSRTGVDPSQVQFEITESALMENRQAASEMLRALREMGASIAVDDFGTGYSSLSYLKRLPIDVVKIDRTFIRDITTDHNDRAIVSTVVAMAHGLGLTVVAEGVETEEQLALIRELGCDAWQGFLFSKAVPPDELEALVAQQASRLKAEAAVD